MLHGQHPATPTHCPDLERADEYPLVMRHAELSDPDDIQAISRDGLIRR